MVNVDPKILAKIKLDKAKKRRGRPKGSRNKFTLDDYAEKILKPMVAEYKGDPATWRIKTDTPSEPSSYLSRLEAATVKYEQAINEAITALKGG